MIMVAKMDTTTATNTSTPLLVTLIHTRTIRITQTNMGRLVCLTMTTQVIMRTRIQIPIPPTLMITASTTALIPVIVIPLSYLRSGILIRGPTIIANNKRMNLRILIHTCMNIPTSHILIPALQPSVKTKPNNVRSLLQSESENPIPVAHHFKSHSTTIDHFQHPQFKFHFHSHPLWIRRSHLLIPAHLNMIIILCTTMVLMVTLFIPTDTITITITTTTVTTCAGCSYM